MRPSICGRVPYTGAKRRYERRDLAGSARRTREFYTYDHRHRHRLEAPAELSSERVRDIFSHIARKYERFNALSSFGAYKLWLAGMMRQAPIDESHDVLDIAGGTGDVTFTVARTKHPRHIQCTDLVPEMLDVARMHIDEGDGAGVPIDFEVVDAQNIPYEDASYDVITMAYGIRNMPDRPRALSEMFRVLKPGGSLVCLEFSTPPMAHGGRCTTSTCAILSRSGAGLSPATRRASCTWRSRSAPSPTRRGWQR